MKLVTVAQMQALENEATGAGLPYATMMENAGRGVAEVLRGLETEFPRRSILGLVGPGNNGGDALVALAELAAAGWTVAAYLVHREHDSLQDRVRKAGGTITPFEQDSGGANLSDLFRSSVVVLDGLLGTGVKPPVRGEIAAVMVKANALLRAADESPYVVAVDCPSGIDCDSGEIPDRCIPADLTVTMAAVKQGLLRFPAFDYVGDLQLVDIGLPAGLPTFAQLGVDVADAAAVAEILPGRPSNAHKGTFGTALVVAGSVNYTGAALLAGGGAYRIGAGLVTLAVPSTLHAALAGYLPEATWLLLPHEVGVISRDAASVLVSKLSDFNALLVGPGLGTENTTAEFIQRLCDVRLAAAGATIPMGFIASGEERTSGPNRTLPPMVVDADGLKLLARIPEWWAKIPAPAVLTPHPGEMAALTSLSIDDVQRNRFAIASKYAREWGHVVVLKGAFTVVASPMGPATIIPVATAALARAGTGDVLAGMIVGLRAQGVPAYEAAVAGAWIHGHAGLHAAARLGTTASVLAGDVLKSVADVISELP